MLTVFWCFVLEEEMSGLRIDGGVVHRRWVLDAEEDSTSSSNLSNEMHTPESWYELQLSTGEYLPSWLFFRLLKPLLNKPGSTCRKLLYVEIL